MGLLDGGLMNLGGNLADELGKSSSAAGSDTYGKPFAPETFDTFGGPVRAGKEVEIGRYRAPAGTEVRWGEGTAKNATNQGFAWAQIRDDTDIPVYGRLIFKWANSTGRSTRVVEEIDSADIDTADRYNRDKQKPFPEKTDKPAAEQDQFLVLTFVADADATISEANTSCRFPATEYDVSA